MYGICIKTKETENIIKIGSYANSVESAIDKVIDILGYFEGFFQPDKFFIKEHPQSTIRNPKFYCIGNNDIFKIYHHYKSLGIFFNEHIYDKICTIKVVNLGIIKKIKRNSYFMYKNEWNEIIKDINILNDPIDEDI